MHENFITRSQCCQIAAVAAPLWMVVAIFQQTTMIWIMAVAWRASNGGPWRGGLQNLRYQ